MGNCVRAEPEMHKAISARVPWRQMASVAHLLRDHRGCLGQDRTSDVTEESIARQNLSCLCLFRGQ